MDTRTPRTQDCARGLRAGSACPSDARLVTGYAETAHAAIRSGGTVTPYEMVVRLNRTLYEDVANRLGTDLYMTLVALRYEGAGRFTHAGAHLELLIHRRATDIVDRVTTDGMLLAIDPDISETTIAGSFELELGDTLVLYTDGCTESRSPSGEMLNTAGMDSLIRKNAHLPSKELAEAANRDLREWCADQRPDDITVIAVRRSA